MPAWRCSTCNINYPTAEKQRLGDECKKCGGEIYYFTNVDFHHDWRDRIRDKSPETEAEPLRWGPHPDEDGCPVIYSDPTDTLHVQDKNLRALGYLPEAGDVVKLNGKYYELLGFSLRGRMWWIEPFYFTQTSQEIADADVWTGPSSDDIQALDHNGKTIYWDPRKDPFNDPEVGG